MKALVLCAGKATRLRPLTHAMPKSALPLANKPILHHILEQIQQAGIEDIGVVVSPQTEASICECINGQGKKASITYINQDSPQGLAHAVKVARGFLQDSSFLMFLGDNLIAEGVAQFVSGFNEKGCDAQILLKAVDDPRRFGVAELNGFGKVVNLVEKPAEPRSNLALVGGYIFNASIHPAIDRIKPSSRGELEITDAIQELLDSGSTVRSHILEGKWLDIGKMDDLLEANRFMLDRCTDSGIQDQKINSNNWFEGQIQVEPEAIIEYSRISGPVAIGRGCCIRHSDIGPYTAIGPYSTIENSSIENSLIMSNCTIEGAEGLTESVLGSNTVIAREKVHDTKLKLLLGDDAMVKLK